MKRTTIIAAMLMASVVTFATGTNKKTDETSTMAIANNATNQFKLVYLEKSEGLVNVYLKNERGQILHRANIQNKDGFAQNFNLNSLPEGDYTFTVKTSDGTRIEDKVQVVHKENEPNFNVDVLNVNDAKKFRLAVVNKSDQELATTIAIYDVAGHQIHSEQVNNLVGFRKMYDLTKVSTDSFTFEIKNSTGTKYIKTK